MTQTQETKQAFTGSLFWKEETKGSGVWENIDVRILAAHPVAGNNSGQGWLQTRTHLHMYEANGRKRPFTYECPRGNHIGDYATAIPCAACDETNRRFKSTGPVGSRFWAWVIDEKDENKLKTFDMPYSVYKAVLEATNDPELDSYAQGGNLFTVPLRIKRTGKGLNTTYTVSARKQVPYTVADLRAALAAQGFDKTPPLIAPYEARKYPPINQLSDEQLDRLNKEGKLPFQTEQGPGHEAMEVAHESFSFPDEPLVSAAATAAPATAQAAPATVAQEALASTVNNTSPVLDIVSDELPFDTSLVNAPQQDIYTAADAPKVTVDETTYVGDLF